MALGAACILTGIRISSPTLALSPPISRLPELSSRQFFRGCLRVDSATAAASRREVADDAVAANPSEAEKAGRWSIRIVRWRAIMIRMMIIGMPLGLLRQDGLRLILAIIIERYYPISIL